MAEKTKLIDFLKEEIKKDEKSISLESAERAVKKAARDMQFEVANAELRVEDLKESYNRILKSPSSSAVSILNAKREVALAEQDFAEMQKILTERF